jgi:hypothetical protein
MPELILFSLELQDSLNTVCAGVSMASILVRGQWRRRKLSFSKPGSGAGAVSSLGVVGVWVPRSLWPPLAPGRHDPGCVC